GDGRRGRRHRRRVRRLAEGPGLHHHHYPEQHEHLGGVRRSDLDFGRRVAALRRRRAVGALVGAVGRRHRLSRTGKGKGSHVMTRTLSLALAALLATAGSASAQEKFTFALNWFAVGDHAAYWVALEKGYYKAKGLDVTLENSKASGDSIPKAMGDSSAKGDPRRADAGLADAAVVIASNARGTTVKTVGMVFDKNPNNV